MEIIKVENGSITERNISRPKAERRIRAVYPSTSLPRRLSDTLLRDHGYVELHPTPRPSGDVVTQGQPEQRDGQWYQTWEVRDFTQEEQAERFEQAKARQRDRINSARDATLADGLPYTMPDGTDDVIQMQADDRQNLMGLAIDARDLVAAGETGAVQEFRAKSNTRYSLTPAQMIDLTNAALEHYKGVMAQSWDRKDAIEALELGDYPSLDDAVGAIKQISMIDGINP